VSVGSSYWWHAGIAAGLNFAVILNALLLQTSHLQHRNRRTRWLVEQKRLAWKNRDEGIVFPLAANWSDEATLYLSTAIFSLIIGLAVSAAIDFSFNFSDSAPEGGHGYTGAASVSKLRDNPSRDLQTQIGQVLLFVSVPAYLSTLLRIYYSAVTTSLNARTFFEATTGVVLVCLAAIVVWLIGAAIFGAESGLSPLRGTSESIVLSISILLGLCPSVYLFYQAWLERAEARALSNVQGIDWGHSIRRFRAKPCKKIVDTQAARPSSWKTPCIARFMVW
jgi:hypothetical protein